MSRKKVFPWHFSNEPIDTPLKSIKTWKIFPEFSCFLFHYFIVSFSFCEFLRVMEMQRVTIQNASNKLQMTLLHSKKDKNMMMNMTMLITLSANPVHVVFSGISFSPQPIQASLTGACWPKKRSPEALVLQEAAGKYLSTGWDDFIYFGRSLLQHWNQTAGLFNHLSLFMPCIFTQWLKRQHQVLQVSGSFWNHNPVFFNQWK